MPWIKPLHFANYMDTHLKHSPAPCHRIPARKKNAMWIHTLGLHINTSICLTDELCEGGVWGDAERVGSVGVYWGVLRSRTSVFWQSGRPDYWSQENILAGIVKRLESVCLSVFFFCYYLTIIQFYFIIYFKK